MNTTLTTNDYQIISQHGFANVLINTQTQQKSLNAVVPIAANDVISFFNAHDTFSSPTYLTVQVGIKQHITLMPQFLQYINHSCNPNVFFDTTAMQLICIKDILPGEELRFFYPSTEWQMDQQFVCNCGSHNCLQLIQGAAYLHNETARNYRLTDFIHQQIAAAK
jgi:hypothetical protein